MGRYEDYNEMLYEAYCKAAIDNAIRKARLKKAAHGQLVSSLSDPSDAGLLSLADEWEPELPDKPLTYHTQGQAIQIKDGNAMIMKDRCVYCGKCVHVCPNNAKKVRDDTERVKLAIKSGRPVFCSTEYFADGIFRHTVMRKKL